MRIIIPKKEVETNSMCQCNIVSPYCDVCSPDFANITRLEQKNEIKK